MRKIDQIVLFLLVVAGINWALWGLFEFNLIYYVFGEEWINRTIYFIFGLCGVYVAALWKRITVRLSAEKRR